MTVAADTRAALVEALQEIDGASPYTTLTLTSSVVVGAPPHVLPTVGTGLAYLWLSRSSYGRDEESPVRARRVEMSWHLVVYGGPGPDAEGREDWIDGAAQDVVEALDASLASGALHTAGVLDVGEVEVQPFQGSQPNSSDPAGIWIRLTTLHLDGDS